MAVSKSVLWELQVAHFLRYAVDSFPSYVSFDIFQINVLENAFSLPTDYRFMCFSTKFILIK
jgi:hypothetical protein